MSKPFSLTEIDDILIFMFYNALKFKLTTIYLYKFFCKSKTHIYTLKEKNKLK